MGNKTGKATRDTSPVIKKGQENCGIQGLLSISRESISSLSTAITVNSQRCLLINDSNEELDVEPIVQCTDEISPRSSDVATVIENSDPGNIQSITSDPQSIFETGPLTNVVMPDRIVQKLTTEEWTELIHIFSCSLEQSLKSTLPHEGDPTQHGISLQERNKRSATVNCPVASKGQNHHHHHYRRKRPSSLPPDNIISEHRRRKRQMNVLHSAKVEDVHNCSRGTHRCHRKSCNCKEYITLEQLKDLGLALKTKEDQLAIGQSLECEPSCRRAQKRASLRDTSPHSLEPLCYLGPAVDDEQESSASNMAVADYNMCSAPILPPPPAPATSSCLKVKHLHQHRHKHIHVVHHTTAPLNLKGHYIPSTEQ